MMSTARNLAMLHEMIQINWMRLWLNCVSPLNGLAESLLSFVGLLLELKCCQVTDSSVQVVSKVPRLLESRLGYRQTSLYLSSQLAHSHTTIVCLSPFFPNLEFALGDFTSPGSLIPWWFLRAHVSRRQTRQSYVTVDVKELTGDRSQC